jgi:hypothetical protein
VSPGTWDAMEYPRCHGVSGLLRSPHVGQVAIYDPRGCSRFAYNLTRDSKASEGSMT